MTPYVADPDFTLYLGDVRQVLAALPAGSVDCCVTSPPYWGLRDYGHDGQIGLEQTPDAYVSEMVGVFREVRRVLADAGSLWLNLGDSYTTTAPGSVVDPAAMTGKHVNVGAYRRPRTPHGLKPKDMVGIPWRVAFALQADGWWLRSDIVWSKPNPMPESVTDRPTKSHEYVFLLTKSPRYFFDADAVREPHRTADDSRNRPDYAPSRGRAIGMPGGEVQRIGTNGASTWPAAGRNIRSVWEIATQPYSEAHFATFPEELPRRCIKAGCPEGGTVLDPFMGSGTTALVARRLGRKAIGVELNPDYAKLAARRLSQLSLLAEGAA